MSSARRHDQEGETTPKREIQCQKSVGQTTVHQKFTKRLKFYSRLCNFLKLRSEKKYLFLEFKRENKINFF